MNNTLMDRSSLPILRGKRIRFLREHLLSLSREEFCRNADITPQSLKGWELAWGGGLSQQGALKIVLRSRQLNLYCTEEWLMHGIGRAAMLITSDLVFQESDEKHIARELLLFREIQNSLDTIIKDESMVPLLYPGNYVGGLIVGNFIQAINKDCIIVLDNDEVLVRILKCGDKENSYDLICVNENVSFVKQQIKNAAIKYVAPIVWIRRVFHGSDDIQ